MSRVPSSPNRIDAQTQELDDGFERLGAEDTPFTLRHGFQKRERARDVHQLRDASARERDEQSNEPVTRSISTWERNLNELDFPFVDTISAEKRQNRAGNAAVSAMNNGFVETIDRGVDFRNDDTRGKHWSGERLIEIGTDPEDFPGFRQAIVLAHEIGHAFYTAWTPASGMIEQPTLFRSEAQVRQAEVISERLQGPMIDPDGPFEDYRRQDAELSAQVFASRVVEPQAAERIAPAAVERLEEAFSTLDTDLF